MHSIAKHPPANSQPPATEPIARLLQAIERNLVIADDSDAQRFRGEFSRLASVPDLEKRVEAFAGLLETYAKETNRSIGQQRLGVMQLVSELNAGVAALPEPSSAQFQGIEDRLAAIANLDDLGAARESILAALALIRTGALKQTQAFEALVSGAVERWRTSQQLGSKPAAYSSAAVTPDPLTGLPGRATAQSELTHTLVQFPSCQIAFFVIKRLNLINAKFGFSRGDEVLLKVVQTIAQELPDFNNMFRWSTCAFLIITSPNMSQDRVRSQVQMMELLKMTPTLQWEGKSAMVSVGIDWKVISLREFQEPDALFQRLDGLASSV